MANSNFINRGFLSRNRWKQPDSQQPDFRGKLDIDAVSYELAGWTREKDGHEYLSLKVQPARDNAAARPAAAPHDDQDLDDAFSRR